MAVQLKLLSVNQIEKGTVIYEEDESIESICLVVKGRVLVNNIGAKVLVGSGSFLGVTDLSIGKYKNTYIALDDVIVFAFPIQSIGDLNKVFNANKDYGGLMVASLNRHILELDKIYTALHTLSTDLYTFLEKKKVEYLDLGRKYGHKVIPMNELDEISEYDTNSEIDQYKINYYKESAKIPVDVQKEYHSYGIDVPLHHIKEQADLIINLTTECMGITLYIADISKNLINDTETCLFKGASKLGLDIGATGGQNNEIVKIVDEIVEKINNIENTFHKNVGYQFEVNRQNMEEIYYALITNTGNKDVSTDMQLKYSESDTKVAFAELDGSLKKILDFSELQQDKRTAFEEYLLEFKNLKDKLSTDDGPRRLRKKITDLFYELYELIFLKAYKLKYVDRIIDMFLKYGFVDDTLLSREQLLELYYLKEDSLEGKCQVYNIKDWLIEVYEGRKEPSKSEFDLDYAENLREIKRSTKLTPEEEKDYLTNPFKKLKYEIENMFRYNNRVVNGQMSIFLPILYEDVIISNLKKIYVNTEKMNQVIESLLQVDFSIFHREVIYYDESKGIKKEYIMQQVFPDIILMPTYGYNAIMWQEITGRKRSTPGRFLLPIFAEGSIEELMVKVFGRYRWEICRSIQGISWNDIKDKSLTSEYMDYIQFYKKNRELSEDKKEKLKQQIQKARNNTREVFVTDYETWIKSESRGAIRLNKIVREILSTYCPFPKELRQKVMTQPLFAESMKRYELNRLKKLREIDIRFRLLEKENVELPEVLVETRRFYNDL